MTHWQRVAMFGSWGLVAGVGAPALSALPSTSPAASASARPTFYETTTVQARTLESTSTSVDVLDRATIDAAGARSVAELLRLVPGLHVLASGGRGGVTFASLRGGDPNLTLVLLDGVPLNDPTEPQGGAVNLEELPTDPIERVEVVRGPSGSFYGVSSLAGVVQIFTRQAVPGDWRAGLRADAGNAALLRAAAHASAPAERGGPFAGLVFERERERVGREDFQQLDAQAGAQVGLGRAGDLRLHGRFAHGRASDYPEASGGPRYGSGLLRHSRHDDLALVARLAPAGSDVAGRRFVLGYARRALERDSPAIGFEVPASAQHTVFQRLHVAWHRALLQGTHRQLDAGLSGEREWGRNTSVLYLPPFLGGAQPGDYARARHSAGLYAEVRQALGPALLELALRADVARGAAAQINPRLGASWHDATGRTRLHASAGRTSKLPSFFALASPPALGGNPALRPERTWGGELGLRHDLRAARLALGATMFRHEYRDLVDFDFDLFTHLNRARVHAHGVELSLAWKPHPALSLESDATHLLARDPSGAALLRRPRWVGTSRVTWRARPTLGWRLELRAVAQALDRQIPVPARDRVAGYAVWASSAWWQVRGPLTLRARADNLSNRAYETFVGFPGPRRAFWLGLDWRRP
jgi:outer membrane cobalamin receptor